MYQAYRQGRIKNDPTPNWYEGEIRFFDGYVIPLAQKLGDCGMLGASGDEYLSTYKRRLDPPLPYKCTHKLPFFLDSSSAEYAEANREEWTKKGQEVVEEWAHSLQNGTTKEHEVVDEWASEMQNEDLSF